MGILGEVGSGVNAEQWQAHVTEVGFVAAVKELITQSLMDVPETTAEVHELRKQVDDMLKQLADQAKRLDKLDKPK